MLCRLSIKNYVLIDDLSVDFKSGFTAITGETGAGKSIILGALGLVLGQRADTQCLGNKKNKCSVEVEFSIQNPILESFFLTHDLDFFHQTIIRREISPSGRSRAFVNDTPVNLGLLKELSTYLIDIHSQHQSLLINKQAYQLKIIDSYCHHNDLLKQYKREFNNYTQLKNQLLTLREQEKSLKKELDYNQFLFDEIDSVNLSIETDSSIENELNIFENFEELSAKLSQAIEISETNETSIVSLLNQLESILNSVQVSDNKITPIKSRLNSLSIDLKDCIYDLIAVKEQYADSYDPSRLAFLRDRSAIINKLLHKHSSQSVDQLIELKQSLEKKLNGIHAIDQELESLSKENRRQYEKVKILANKLSDRRLSRLSELEKEIVTLSSSLGMPNSNFKIKHHYFDTLTFDGMDDFSFHFTANKGSKASEISKIASGGEISRLMLCFKYILAQKSHLSSILFDEIDTGVSGEIAHKMADLMHSMATKMQVVSITHLPQVAAKATTHLLVSKHETATHARTTLKELSQQERINELAKMLSGESITDSSLNNATDLLNI